MPKSAEQRLTQHDREIAAIRKLLLQGARALVAIDKRIDKLAAAQLVTEKKLQGVLDAIARGRNGRH